MPGTLPAGITRQGSSSMSNCRVVLGGITPPAPRSPYASPGGITTFLLPPVFMAGMSCSSQQATVSEPRNDVRGHGCHAAPTTCLRAEDRHVPALDDAARAHGEGEGAATPVGLVEHAPVEERAAVVALDRGTLGAWNRVKMLSQAQGLAGVDKLSGQAEAAASGGVNAPSRGRCPRPPCSPPTECQRTRS